MFATMKKNQEGAAARVMELDCVGVISLRELLQETQAVTTSAPCCTPCTRSSICCSHPQPNLSHYKNQKNLPCKTLQLQTECVESVQCHVPSTPGDMVRNRPGKRTGQIGLFPLCPCRLVHLGTCIRDRGVEAQVEAHVHDLEI